MKKSIGALAAASVIALVCAFNPAFADTSVGYPKNLTDGPLHWQEHGADYGHHQTSKAKVLVRTNGEFNVHFVFSNGDRTWGQDYYTKVTFFDRDGRYITHVSSSTALDGTFGGKTNKKTNDKGGVFSPEQYAKLGFYVVEQETTDPDHIRDTIYFAQVIQASVECYYGDCSSAAVMLASR